MLEDKREDIYRCLECSACKNSFDTSEPICPSGERFGFESYFAIGRMEISKSVLENELELSDGIGQRIFTCTSCKACDEECFPTMGLLPLGVIEELKSELVEEGSLPPEVRDFLKNVNKQGNPYGESRRKRNEWVEDTGIKKYEPEDEFLYYVGCVGAYDSRSQDMARALGTIMKEANISFGILGDKENCDGNEVLRLGEKGLFEDLMEGNTELFKELNVESIIALSPHSFNAMKNEYPSEDIEIHHYTQTIRDLIENDGLDFSKNIDKKVTFHDPCFLGRYNEEYEAPREILSSIPGISLVEMERNKENSFCCGGGGGNFYTDLLGGGKNNPARKRIREAFDTGAEILAVACPICLTMFEDALKLEELEEELEVKDISEIVLESSYG